MTDEAKSITINNIGNKPISLKVLSYSKGASILDYPDALSFGEARYQLYEGCEYQYKLTDGYILHDDEIIKTDGFHPSEGRIKTGVYVGTLKLRIYKEEDRDDDLAKPAATIAFEIRSKKADYHTDYKIMLQDLTEDYTELVMMQGSPVTQRFRQDTKGTPQTDYQRFAFVKSIIESDQFAEALHKIQSSPVKRWSVSEEKKSINNIKHLNRKGIRQLLSSNDRVALPENHNLRKYFSTVPHKIDVPFNKETLDTSENRFVKFVLNFFLGFCSSISNKKNAKERLKREAEITIKRLNSFLNLPIFRQVSNPTSLQLNSPVLQRKEGYREVLQAWLMFDLAANLAWNGAENVYGEDYDAGMKNVAALYEYWLYFKMIKVVSDVFHITPRSLSELITTDGDKLVLDLKEGKMKVVEGTYESRTRKLNVRLYYNRTFSHQQNLSKAGSWTVQMRPDYTLSIWTGNIDEEEAEKEDLIVHLHFDAKYRLNSILLSDENNKETEEELTEEKHEEELNIYKRADLLKMHAYKDAIRRTSGAYILYPGNQGQTPIRNYHEIIPGLGAFCIRPGKYEQDVIPLKRFIKDVVNHFLNRVSQREQLAYYKYKINEDGVNYLKDELHEPEGKNRSLLPTETQVLIGFLRGKNRDWTEKNNKYNIRLFTRDGSLMLTSEMMSAKYIVLFTDKDDPITSNIYRVSGTPEIYSSQRLASEGYIKPTSSAYLVYSLKEVDKELADDVYDLRLLGKFKGEGKPITITLADLMKAKIKG